MARVLSRDTRPEKLVRSFLHRSGLRFRLNVRTLPGSPDIVLRRHGAVVFVHGCFWHRHRGCPRASMPGTRAAFWRSKFDRNVERDAEATRKLRKFGWRVMIIWECQTKRASVLRGLVKRIVAPGERQSRPKQAGPLTSKTYDAAGCEHPLSARFAGRGRSLPAPEQIMCLRDRSPKYRGNRGLSLSDESPAR